ncbi:MAG: hypothetical protein RLZZ474_917, partial [Bacteroidota bacterium]
SDSSLSGGLVAAFALFSANYVIKKLEFLFPSLRKVVEGEPIVLVYQGNINESAMANASLNREQLDAAIREHGVASIAEVNLAVLEVDGTISILSDNYQKISKRKQKGHRVLGGNTA